MKHQVLEVINYNDSTFRLRLEKNGFQFEPGQYLTAGLAGSRERRDYTVFSSPGESFLEMLIKDVDGGDVSGLLHRVQRGDEIDIGGPFGVFTIPEERRSAKHIFIATGTGIAPFHSFVSSYPGLDYTILHGVRYPEQLYGYEAFDPKRHISCLSCSDQGDFSGRVTDYLRQNPIDANAFYYLCGSSKMIYEVFELLQGRGVSRDHIITEIYY